MHQMRNTLLVTALVLFFPGLSLAADEPATISTEDAAEAKALRDKALAAFKKKDYAQAVEAYQKSLVVDRRAGAMSNMASALNQLGRYDEALRWYETVLSEFPKSSEKLRLQVKKEMNDLVAKVGTIAVEGEVIKGARLFIDNRDVGPLPLEAPVRVLGGVHEVRAEKPGFTPIKTTVEVTAGQPSIANLVAKDREAKLEIREKHNWLMRVEIDGRDEGLSPLSKIVTVGEHRIRLRGYMQPDALVACENPETPVEMGARMESEEQIVNVGLFETQNVELSAEDMDASLHIDSTPKGATLWIDGHDAGKTPWDGRLPLGEHAIEVRAKGFYLAKQRVNLERRKQREIAISLERVPDPPGFWTGRTVGATSALGIGLIGVGLFGVTGGLALQNAGDLKGACRNGVCPGGKEDQLQKTQLLGNVALAGIIVGGVGIGAGASIWLFGKPKTQPNETRERAGLKVQVGIGTVVIGGSF